MIKIQKKSNQITDKNVEYLKKNFDFGNGVDFSMAKIDHTGNRTILNHYTNKLPKLEIDMVNNKRIIEVEASSVEEDDKKLLHYLYGKTTNG